MESRDFEAFFRSHVDMAYRLALGVTRESAAAEDVVQEAFTHILRNRADLRAVDPRAYLARTIVNTARLHQRGEARRRYREEDAVQPPFTPHQSPVQEIESAESQVAVRAALAEIAEDRRLPVLLHIVDGFSHREVAKILDVPTSSVSYRIGEGLEDMRRMLSRAGFAALAGHALLDAVKPAASIKAPSTLTTALERLVAKEVARTISGAAPTKRGIGMKIGIGVAVLGLVAGVAFLGVDGKSAEPPKTAPAQDAAAAVESRSGTDGYKWPEPDIPVGPCQGEEHVAFLRAKLAYGLGGPALVALRGWQHCGPAFGPKGEIYVFCPANCVIWEITTDGLARIIAGDGQRGYRDGPGDQARFDVGKGGYAWFSLCCDGEGNLYLDDTANNKLRKIFRNPDGTWQVITLFGDGEKRLQPGQTLPASEVKYTGGLVVFKDGSFAFTDPSNSYVMVTKDGQASLLGVTPPRDPGSPNPTYNAIFPPNDPDSVYFWCGRDCNQQLWRYDRKQKKFDHLFGASFADAKKNGDFWSGSPATKIRTHTTGCTLSPNGSVAFTGGGDEAAMRRVYRNTVKYVMAEGPDQVTKDGKIKDPAGSLTGGNMKGIDAQGRVYITRGNYAYGTWLTRLVFAKEE